MNKVDSDPPQISCWVPQGSILGPFFSCVMLMTWSPVSTAKLLPYADDSALLVSDKNPPCVADKLIKESESCRQWLVDDKLSLHLGKTEYVLFGSKNKLKKVDIFSVTCDGNEIKPSNSANYLGITLDESLSGEAIACDILKKAGARLGFLYRHGHLLSEKLAKL